MKNKKIKKNSNTKSYDSQKIIKNALKQLENNKEANFDSATILSKYSLFDIAKKIIITNIKDVNQNPVDFILAISTYLSQNNVNLIKENQLETHKTIIKDVKYFFKHIKKALKIIQKQFCKTYLLYEKDRDKFYAIDNAKLIFALEELSQILNLTNKYKEAEIAFELKSKIELGFQRYFLHKKESILLNEFSKQGQFVIASLTESMNIYKYYKFDAKLETNFKTNNFLDILKQLLHLKQTNKTKFKKQANQYREVFDFFPNQIYKKEEYDMLHKISLSINKDFEDNAVQLVKKKLVLFLPYNIDSINLTLELFQK